MSKVLVENSTLYDIANAIRAQSQDYSDMLPSEMSSRIFDIDTEKVYIDNIPAQEELYLYGFQNQVTLDINAPTEPNGYTYEGELYDGTKLYMKTTLTRVTDGSSSSSSGCTGTVLVVKPNGTQLSIAIPTYTIPSTRSETGTSPDYYTYNCYLICQFDNDVYLRIEREYTDIRGTNTLDHSSVYSSIYKLNIGYSSLFWFTKVIELFHGTDKYFYNDNLIIEDNYIYACDGSGHSRYIYGYKYGDTSYTFQKISTNYINGSDDCDLFVRKGTNTYIFFRDSSTTLTNNWISITRNSDGTYIEASGTASLSRYGKTWKSFMLNGEVYIQMLGNGEYSGYEGLQYYKLNSDISKWKEYINFSTTATTYTTSITNFLNGSPKLIFQGASDTYSGSAIVRSDGTFDLNVFSPGTLSYQTLNTPTVNNTFGYYTDKWTLYKFIYNDQNQKAYFFSIKPPNGGYNGYYPSTRYKCVLENMDNTPVLYSTFEESELIN